MQMCIKLDINGVSITCILDSGAEFSIISLNAVKRCGLYYNVIKQNLRGDGLIVKGCTGSERMYGVLDVLKVEL